MSYSKDSLQSKINSLHSKYNTKMNEFVLYVSKIERLHKHSSNYAYYIKDLLNDVLKVKIDNSFPSLIGTGLNSLGKFLSHQKECFEIFSDGIKNGIINESQIFIKEKNEEEKMLYNDFKKLENEYSDAVYYVNKSQTKYMSELKSIENAILDHEVKGSPNEGEQYVTNKITYGKEYEESYYSNIKKANMIREKYMNTSLVYLQKYKDIDAQIVDRFQKNIISIEVVATLRNSNEKCFIQDLGRDMKLIDYNKILANETLFDSLPFDEVVFKPYQMNIFQLPENTKVNVNNEMVYDIVTLMQKNYTHIAEHYDAVSEKKKNDVLRITHLICDNPHNEPLSSYNKELIHNLFKEKSNRLIFLTYLNNMRVTGHFNLGRESFKQLGNLMLSIIDIIKQEKEYESMRYCLIMCQTYWFVNAKKEKIYLQGMIEKHELFQSVEFWEFFFSDSLYQEIDNQSKVISSENETEEEKNNRFGNVAFSKLISLAHSMMDFNVDKSKVRNLITAFGQQYNVTQELLDQIHALIDEVVYEDKKPFDAEVDLKEEAKEEEGIIETDKKDQQKPINENIIDDHF